MVFLMISSPHSPPRPIDFIAVYGYNTVRIILSYFIQGGVKMNIRPSAAIRQNYNEIADMCRKTAEPVFLTKNGEGDLVVMDIETFNRREKMLKLRERTVDRRGRPSGRQVRLHSGCAGRLPGRRDRAGISPCQAIKNMKLLSPTEPRECLHRTCVFWPR